MEDYNYIRKVDNEAEKEMAIANCKVILPEFHRHNVMRVIEEFSKSDLAVCRVRSRDFVGRTLKDVMKEFVEEIRRSSYNRIGVYVTPSCARIYLVKIDRIED